jgi:trehalose 2-sulfotransferase
MAHELAYFLCATPRSGTTLLCDFLSGTGRAGRPQSYYRCQDMERRANAYGLQPKDFLNQRDFDCAYLQAVLQEGTAETGIFGLRIMWGTIGELAKRMSWLQPAATPVALFDEIFGPLVYVHVGRRDKVAQAVSLLKAEQSGLWHLAADGSERQRTAPAVAVRYDGDRIASLVAELERDDAAWSDFFAMNGIKPVRVEYESLDTNPRAEVQKILEALHVPPAFADSLKPQTSKMADAESDAWRERFLREQRA